MGSFPRAKTAPNRPWEYPAAAGSVECAYWLEKVPTISCLSVLRRSRLEKVAEKKVRLDHRHDVPASPLKSDSAARRALEMRAGVFALTSLSTVFPAEQLV